MRQINPWAKAWSNSEKTYNARLRGIRSRKKWHQYLNGHHLFERHFSSEPVGETKVMTGEEANEANCVLVKKYIKQADLGNEGRALEEWKPIKLFVKPNDEAQNNT